MSQIAASTKKLQLLEKTNEIEEEERDRMKKKVSERNSKFLQVRAQNESICVRASSEVDLRQEAAERKALLHNLKDSIKDMPWMNPLVELLENSQGKIIYLKIKLNNCVKKMFSIISRFIFNLGKNLDCSRHTNNQANLILG